MVREFDSLIENGEAVSEKTRTFDEILDEIGVSPLQFICVLICGLGNAADAVEILAIGNVITQLEATGLEKGILSGAVFLGMLLGSLAFGGMSDHYGRKSTFLASTFINFVAGVMFAASGYWASGHALLIWLIIFRFVAGFGVGGCMPIVFPYATEMVPAKNRGAYIIGGVAAFWMVGSLYAAGFAWLLLGEDKGNWQIYAFICAAPALLCCVMIAVFMPESPRFLMVKGNSRELITVLLRFARSAGKVVNVHEIHVEKAPPRLGQNGTTVTWLEYCKQTAAPLIGPDVRRVFILQTIIWFCMNFGWYGLILWFPTLFEKRGISESNAFAMSFYVALANLPGNIVSAYLSDIIGRRWLLAGCMFLSSFASIGFIFSRTQLEATLSACLFNALSIGAWNALDCLSSEMFPTYTRSAALGILAAVGRVGSLIAQEVNGYLSDSSVALVLIVACGFMIVGAIASVALPETAKAPLEDFKEID